MDSFRIHEDIKRGYASRDALIENYRKNIRMLAECGIRIICYNFMPVFDWTRTDLAHVLPDGSDCLSFEEEKVRAVDPERGIELPGWGTNHTPAELQALLHSYRGIGEEELWDNCRYFLRAVLPVAEECGVKLALHPDDPPRPIFGLPRIAKNAADYRRILFTPDLDSPATPSPSAAAPWAPARTTICRHDPGIRFQGEAPLCPLPQRPAGAQRRLLRVRPSDRLRQQ